MYIYIFFNLRELYLGGQSDLAYGDISICVANTRVNLRTEIKQPLTTQRDTNEVSAACQRAMVDTGGHLSFIYTSSTDKQYMSTGNYCKNSIYEKSLTTSIK